MVSVKVGLRNVRMGSRMAFKIDRGSGFGSERGAC